VNEIRTLTYNLANSVLIKKAILMNIIHNTFNLRDTGEREYRVFYILACYRYNSGV
jgi:hypothetical protein